MLGLNVVTWLFRLFFALMIASMWDVDEEFFRTHVKGVFSDRPAVSWETYREIRIPTMIAAGVSFFLAEIHLISHLRTFQKLAEPALLLFIANFQIWMLSLLLCLAMYCLSQDVRNAEAFDTAFWQNGLASGKWSFCITSLFFCVGNLIRIMRKPVEQFDKTFIFLCYAVALYPLGFYFVDNRGTSIFAALLSWVLFLVVDDWAVTFHYMVKDQVTITRFHRWRYSVMHGLIGFLAAPVSLMNYSLSDLAKPLTAVSSLIFAGAFFWLTHAVLWEPGKRPVNPPAGG